jgi:hypothetical protein
VLKYTGSQGKTLTGRITTIDQKFQHMVFYINFPNNTLPWIGNHRGAVLQAPSDIAGVLGTLGRYT